jgi:putative transposase
MAKAASHLRDPQWPQMADAVPMLLWALLASGQITMRKVDGWQTLDKPIQPMTLDLAA